MGDFSILALRIKELRKGMNKTQREFAELVGCTSATLSAYENGAKSPSLEIVKNIAENCHVSMDWLCGLTQENQEDNGSTKTYGDLIKYLAKAFDNYDLELFIDTRSPSSTIFDEDEDEEDMNKFSDIILGINLYGDISRYDFISLFIDWSTMRKLVKKGVIKKEVIDLWLDNKVKEFSDQLIEGLPF